MLIAAEEISGDEVFAKLHYPDYFDLLKLPLPESRDNILQALESDELIKRTESGKWNITNLGAILFAKKITDFRSLRRKAVRMAWNFFLQFIGLRCEVRHRLPTWMKQFLEWLHGMPANERCFGQSILEGDRGFD